MASGRIYGSVSQKSDSYSYYIDWSEGYTDGDRIENKSVVPVVNYQTLVLEIEMFHNPKNTTAIAICLQNHAIYLDLQCLYCLKTPLYRHDSVV